MATDEYIMFLRGINVGGRHKLPMADLKLLLIAEGASHVQTLQNAGNVLLRWKFKSAAKKEDQLAGLLEEKFGFPVPVMLRSGFRIKEIIEMNPFQDREPSPDFHYFVSFLKEAAPIGVQQQWNAADKSISILGVNDREVFSIVDRRSTSSPDAMQILEKRFGKAITTRNWNTVLRLAYKLGE